ncbi:MAG: DeoR/GlpR transcriptional regulator [Bacillaceae bacterium]|jgi:DeoR/GlpR family transcriptional regulator of sugar metabolism|uniref:Lactose phosphotransferase system repressor n=1 Tax=Aeribacillus composti TaxID=1868734 RepID=A0ABY9WAE6_9BACI|nr:MULTISPECIES: DeoR/GlpR family DNA-binding transcription regulator [Aeribacillus]REJ19224.1 MAG: DeoR/GlpR transcriptional regulator [Bacillaceae bacterium]KZM53415.1 DeoR family transcriptional regulator [Aeribacillus pallidus]MDR9793304.1 DeoR/GlpR family DNA-binding transcription regulator [Aeribacillus pallidus]MDR9796849.1 DeoR/GlpR family DNA-binding transcription regulator [Aeribacillus pallidus]MED0649277.1 DeoR/GlpR family DNA-binding transcription regulator [Aeribacillus composti]
MLKEERQQKILQILNEEHKVIASDLSKRLSVSEDTIRRDLKELDNRGLIKRVHSGALRIGPPVVDFSTRQHMFNEVKIKLAKKALSFIKEDMVLLIDGGTTNLHLVNQLPLTLKATVITNSPPIAMALTNHQHIDVIMIGGTLFKQSMVNLGIDTVESLSNMRADLYIMGIYKIDPYIGISVPSLSEALVKRKMASISSEILGMATSDKLSTVSNHIVCPTKDLTYLITENISPNIKKIYGSQQVVVVD